jgi:hypothetical protein
MKVILRFISIITSLAVLWTVFFVIRYYKYGGMSRMIVNIGIALPTILGWLLTLVLGPFAAVQLWRLRNGGRVATMLLVAYAILYYSYGLLFLGKLGAQIQSSLPMILMNFLALIILALPATKKACLSEGHK